MTANKKSCVNCGAEGHWYNECPRPRQGVRLRLASCPACQCVDSYRKAVARAPASTPRWAVRTTAERELGAMLLELNYDLAAAQRDAEERWASTQDLIWERVLGLIQSARELPR
jgi:hypothetical protein